MLNNSSNQTPHDFFLGALFVMAKRKRMIVSIFFAIAFGIGMGTFLITPTWEATTKVLVMQNPPQEVRVFEDLYGAAAPEKNLAVDLVEVLNSYEFGREIVEKYRLDELERRKAENPRNLREKLKLWIADIVRSPIYLLQAIGLLPEVPPNFYESALDELLDDMEEIELEEGTSTIMLTVSAESPEMAVGIANDLAAMLKEKVKGFDRRQADENLTFIKGQLGRAEADLLAAEQRLVKFMQDAAVIDLDNQRQLRLERLEAAKGEYENNAKSVAALTARLRNMEAQLDTVPEQIATSIERGPNSIYVSLKEQLLGSELELAGKKVDFLPKYPELQGLKSRIETGYEKLDEEKPVIVLKQTSQRNPVVSSLEKDVAEARAGLAELEGRNRELVKLIGSLESDLQTFSAKEMELTRLQREVEGLRARYNSLRDKALKLEVQRYTESSQFDIKISDPAWLPPDASNDWPIWWLSALVIVVLGPMIAIGAAFVAEFWSDTIRRPEELELSLGLRDLGAVPPLGSVLPDRVIGSGGTS